MKSEARRDPSMPTAPTESSVTPSQPLTMIECVGCGDIAFTLVVYPEADALFSDGTISRPCKLCGKRTQWGRLLITPAITRN